VAFKAFKAAGAGIVGAIVMTALGAVAAAAGLRSSLELMLGSAVMGNTSAAAWGAGFGLHLALGAFFGLVYGALLERATQTTAEIGVSIGSIHAVLSGVALTAVPAVHPLVPDTLIAPGMFLSNLGIASAIFFVALHLVFGAVVGAVYGSRRRSGVAPQAG
jgi:hypothetical protein